MWAGYKCGRASADRPPQIIARARELHLLDAFREAQTSSPPSASLKADVQTAWNAYFAAKVCKCLLESERPASGDEAQVFDEVNKRFAADPESAWAKAMKAKDEKIGLYLTSLVSGS